MSHMNLFFFQDKNTFKLYQGKLKANPLVPRVISGKCYFEFQAVVVSNPKCNDFIDSNLTRLKFVNLHCFQLGVAIHLQLKYSKQIINFFHFDFFQPMDTIQILGTHSIERLDLIQEYFNKTDFSRVGAVVSIFIDELEGKVTLSTMPAG